MNELATTEVIRITQYEALKNDIAIAKQEASNAIFQYEDPKGNKAARSYVHSVRLLKGRIEAARKEAKSYALEYGRKVDAVAKEMESEVVALIAPHQEKIEEIEKREKQRVAGHRERLDLLAFLSNVENMDSSQISERIAEIKAFATEDMEEFTKEANAAKDAIIADLTEQFGKQKKAEDDAAELARLRKQEEERQQAEREERIRKEAREQAEREAAQREAQIRAEAAAKEQAAKEREERLAREAKEAEARRVEQERERAAQEELNKQAAAAREEQLQAQLKQEQEREAQRQAAIEQARKDAIAKKRSILNEIYAALMANAEGLTKDQAKAITEAIDQGKVPHIKTPWNS